MNCSGLFLGFSDLEPLVLPLQFSAGASLKSE
jgi:hypothetical protein